MQYNYRINLPLCYNFDNIMIKTSKLFNFVHHSGYRFRNIKFSEITIDERKKFGLPEPEDITVSELEMIGFENIVFLEPLNRNNIELRKFDIESLYTDIIVFCDKYLYLGRDGLIDGDSGEELLALINKYGWMNWANEPMRYDIYTYIHKWAKFYGRFQKDSKIKLNESEIINFANVNRFMKQLRVAREIIDNWIDVIILIGDDQYREFTLSKMVGMIAFESNTAYKNTITPYSIGANLIYFHKLMMPKYNFEECKTCSKLYIQKRNTKMFCSNTCRAKYHNEKK